MNYLQDHNITNPNEWKRESYGSTIRYFRIFVDDEHWCYEGLVGVLGDTFAHFLYKDLAEEGILIEYENA